MMRLGPAPPSGLGASRPERSRVRRPRRRPVGWKGIPSVKQCMSDYFRCSFPEPLDQNDDSVAAHFDAMNGDLEARVSALKRSHPDAVVVTRAAQGCEILNFQGSYLGQSPLVSAHFWTSDHLSSSIRRVNAFSDRIDRQTLELK